MASRRSRRTPIQKSTSSSSLFEEEQGFDIRSNTNANKSEEIIVLSSSASSQQSSSDGSSISYCNSSTSSMPYKVYTQDQREGVLSTLRKDDAVNNASILETQPPPPLPPISSETQPNETNTRKRRKDMPNYAEHKIYDSNKRRNKGIENFDAIYNRENIDYSEHGRLSPCIEQTRKEGKSSTANTKRRNTKDEMRDTAQVESTKKRIKSHEDLSPQLSKKETYKGSPDNSYAVSSISETNLSNNSISTSAKPNHKPSVLETMVPIADNAKKSTKNNSIKENAILTLETNTHSNENLSLPEDPTQIEVIEQTQCSVDNSNSALETSSVTECSKNKTFTEQSTFSPNNKKNKVTLSPEKTPSNKCTNNAPKSNAKKESTKKKPLTKKKTLQDQTFYTMYISSKPYTLKTLSQTTKCTEQVLHSMMLSLVDKGLVKKKEFTLGKSGKANKTLYWANQDVRDFKEVKIDIASEAERKSTLEEYNKLLKQHKSILEELENVEKEPSNEELDAMIQKLENENTVLNQSMEETNNRIKKGFHPSLIKGNTINKFNKNVQYETNPTKVKKEINHYRNEWKSRKEKCMDFVDNFADAMEKKLKDVFKTLDLERDEDLGVVIPKRHDID